MTLPNRFKFRVNLEKYPTGSEDTYTMEKIPDTGYLKLMNEDATYVYHEDTLLTTAESNVENGHWLLVHDPNGVDAEGNPIYFSKEDLKACQRVVAGGEEFILCEVKFRGKSRLIVAQHTGRWNEAYLESDVESDTQCTGITEVYDVPEWGYQGLKASNKGELIWKYVPSKSKEQLDLEAQLESAERILKNEEAQVESSRLKISQLKEKLAALPK